VLKISLKIAFYVSRCSKREEKKSLKIDTTFYKSLLQGYMSGKVVGSLKRIANVSPHDSQNKKSNPFELL
jgi:hypothetical protein